MELVVRHAVLHGAGEILVVRRASLCAHRLFKLPSGVEAGARDHAGDELAPAASAAVSHQRRRPTAVGIWPSACSRERRPSRGDERGGMKRHRSRPTGTMVVR